MQFSGPKRIVKPMSKLASTDNTAHLQNQNSAVKPQQSQPPPSSQEEHKK